MNSKMNNDYLKFVAEEQGSDRCTYTKDNEDNQGHCTSEMVYLPANAMHKSTAFALKHDLTRSNIDEDAIARLRCMFEVQQKEIVELRLKTNELDVEMNVQKILAAREMASVREKCQHAQRGPQESEENPPRNGQHELEQSKIAWDLLIEENASLKRENNDLLGEINSLKSILAQRSVQVSPECENTTNRMTDDAVALTKEEQQVNLCNVNLTDSNAVKRTTRTDEKLQKTAAIVENAVVQVNEVTTFSEDHTIDDLFKRFSPISVLLELSKSRSWAQPEYAFLESGEKYKPLFSAECTLLQYKFKADGPSKKEAKRLAAIGMYRIVTKHNAGNVPCAKKSAGELHESAVIQPSNISRTISADACVYSSAISHEKPAVIADFVDPPEAAAVEPQLPFSPEHTELINRLRVSNNPAIRKLKEIGSINQFTVHNYVEFLNQIADEEQLSTLYDMSTTPATLNQDLATIGLTISPLEITAFGHGESAFDAQTNAAFVYLTWFKLMLKE